MFKSYYQISTIVEVAAKRQWVPSTYDIYSNRSQSKLTQVAFSSEEPLFSDLILKRPFTDFIYDGGAIGGKGFVISQRVKDIFENTKAPNLRFYKLRTLESAGGDESEKNLLEVSHITYYYMQIVKSTYLELIDFEKSRFIEHDVISETEKSLRFSKEEEFVDYIKNLKLKEIRAEEIVFKCTLEFDLYCFSPIYIQERNWIIVSETILNQLLGKKVTGFSYLPVSLQ